MSAHSKRAAVLGGKRPVLQLAPVGKELQLVLSQDHRRAVALLMPAEVDIAHIEACYALGNGVWSDNIDLARAWGCWGVLADPAWAKEQLRAKAPRPQGAKLFFVS